MTSVPAISAEPALARDVEYTSGDFQRIANLLRELSGIRMPPSNEALVFSRLSKRVKRLGYTRFSDYVDLIAGDAEGEERNAMIEALTTNTTRFFREAHHFETVESDLMPEIVQWLKKNDRIRLWSAGCSSGEESYSLAATVVKSCAEVAQFDLKILATDIDRSVIKKATAAQYRSDSCSAVPEEYAKILFDGPVAERDYVGIHPQVKSMVTFRYLNFMEPWPVRGPFTAIFCRNVMIYMEEETQAQVWAGLASVLEPGGYLFIGHSERVGPELKGSLEMIGTTTFRKI